MPTRSGINASLFQALSDSPASWVKKAAPASLDRFKDPRPYFLSHAEILPLMRDFLNSTTDSIRLFSASRLCRAILDIFDLDEIEDLRLQVQLSELLRVIPYGRQTDHTAHTLYVYYGEQ